MAFLHASGLGKSFSARGGSRHVLRDVSLAVERGEFVSIVGAMGSGKSTLLSILAGLTTADSGEVRVGGLPVSGVRRDAAYVFQNYSLLPWFTALENVRLAVAAACPALSRDEQKARARHTLEQIGLANAIHRRPSQLSGGMRQRVAIARAFAATPQLLFMDEPFGALDEITRDRLNEELLSVWERTGTTILFVTHSIYEAAFLAQEVLLLAARPGRVKERVPVDLPHPRKIAMRETPEFVALVSHLRRVLETC